MAALGFAWTIKPLTRRLFGSVEEQKSFLKRHLLGFNANPYMINYAVGAVVKLEEDKAPEEQIIRFKGSLRGPLGAIGDRLIWQNLRPALLILGLILCIFIGAVGVLVFWLIFNLYQAYQRARGLAKGFALGSELSSELTRGYLQKMTEWCSRMGALLLGILFVLKFAHLGIEPQPLEKIPLFVGFSWLSVMAFRKNVRPNYILWLSLSLFLVIKAMIWMF